MPVKGYIIHRNARRTPGNARRLSVDSIDFDVFEPLSNNVMADYDEVVVRGRSEPISFYNATSEDSYNFKIKLVSSMDEQDNGNTSIVWNKYLFLKSFQFPDYDNGQSVIAPSHAIIVIGNFFRHRGIIKNPTFQFMPPYDDNGYPHMIECDFTFRVFNPVALSYGDIIQNVPQDQDL